MKQKLRVEHIKKRANLEKQAVSKKSKKIAAAFLGLEETKKAKTILLYASIQNEVQTLQLIRQLLKLGKRIVLPVTNFETNELHLSEIKEFSDLETKKSGLLEPKKDLPVKLEEISLVVVPGVSFSKTGERLGRGEGFYDRLLKEFKGNIKLVGFCFEENLEEKLPKENHDVNVDIVITEERILHSKAESIKKSFQHF